MGYFDSQTQDSTLLNSPEELANTVLAMQRLQNGTGGVGSIFPPRLAAGTSIPLASGARVTSVSALTGSTNVALQWFDPQGFDGLISTYNIYAKSMVGNNQAPQLVASSMSPALFTFQTDNVNQVAFTIQTVMQNGQTSPINASPTCTVTSASPTLTPASIATQQIVVSGMTLTSNSPGAGSIAWSACTVYYNGTAYAVSGSNTSSAYVYWTVGGSTFTTGASYTPSSTVFLVATNNGGTADTAWNKVASKHIQEANLNFSLLTGQQVQPLVAFTSPLDNAGMGVGASTISTTVLSTTGDGVHTGGGLLTVAVRVIAARDFSSHTPPQIDIQIQIDGQTPETIRIFEDANAFSPVTTWTATSKDIAVRVIGDGTSVGDTLVFQMGLGFSASLNINYIRTRTAGSPSIADATGQNAVTVLYCTKTT